MTGGKFGLEASMAAVFVATIAGLILLWKAYEKGTFVGPMWRSKPAYPAGGEPVVDEGATRQTTLPTSSAT